MGNQFDNSVHKNNQNPNDSVEKSENDVWKPCHFEKHHETRC